MTLKATTIRQGNVPVAGTNVLFPSIAMASLMNSPGLGAMTFAVSG